MILTEKRDDANDKIFVFFPNDDKMGVPTVRECIEEMSKSQVESGIVIVKNTITPFARETMRKFAVQYKLERFNQSELMVNITKHKLVPKHVVLTDEEKKQLLKKYKLSESQLPKIQVTDPVARYFGMRPRQVVKILRPSETAGKYITYRLVI